MGAGADCADPGLPAGSADAPPVETPARNLPPLDRRNSPTHYSPRLNTR
jgi:hypothetical protein